MSKSQNDRQPPPAQRTPVGELKAHLAAIVESSDDAIVSKDLNGVVQSWNGGAQRIFGYTPDEIVGKPITMLFPPDRLGEESDFLSRIRRGERVDHYETVRVRKDGRPIEISVTLSPVRDQAGEVVGVSKIARDVTELKQFARERERLYQLARAMAEELDIHALVQMATDAATESSGAQFGAFFYNVVNAEGESLMLYTLSGVERETFANFPMPRNTAVFDTTFTGKGILRSDDITKDPRYGKNAPHKGLPAGHLPVRSYLSVPVMGAEGKVLGGLFFGHAQAGVFNEHSEALVRVIADYATTALKKAHLHNEIKASETRFRMLANSIPQLAWMAKPDGWIFWYNERWYEYTGMPPETQAGWGWEQVHDPKELPRVVERWKSALAAGTSWEDNFPLRRHDGEFRWHLSRALPLRNADGEIVYWFGTNTDITEQLNLARQREELLGAERAARSEAERVSRMKDEFLATLSHELRTPLNAILGWSQILKRGADDPATLEEGVTVIERNTRAQAQLIDDLLDMSRIISGKIRLDVQRVDLAAVVDSAVNSLRPAADARQIRLIKVLDPDAGPVSGDPNRLQQVVWNLLSNAIKFTPKQGTVEMLLERVNSHVRVTVSDTGQGIAPEFVPHVFERFRQADATTTRRHGGLGLGLSIVKHLVELHGGKVEVTSAGLGHGATFSFALPLLVTRREIEQAPAMARDSGVSLKGLSVMIVDDERDARELLARLLGDTQARVLLEESAEGALETLKRERPDILISDIGMPGVDGYQLIREVRSLKAEEGGRTPAIALTAFARSEDRTRAMMAGYHVHLSKPVEPTELIATVATLAGRTGLRQS